MCPFWFYWVIKRKNGSSSGLQEELVSSLRFPGPQQPRHTSNKGPPFWMVATCKNTQPLPLFNLETKGGHWTTQLFSDPGKKGFLFWEDNFSGAAHQKKGKKGATVDSLGATEIADIPCCTVKDIPLGRLSSLGQNDSGKTGPARGFDWSRPSFGNPAIICVLLGFLENHKNTPFEGNQTKVAKGGDAKRKTPLGTGVLADKPYHPTTSGGRSRDPSFHARAGPSEVCAEVERPISS